MLVQYFVVFLCNISLGQCMLNWKNNLLNILPYQRVVIFIQRFLKLKTFVTFLLTAWFNLNVIGLLNYSEEHRQKKQDKLIFAMSFINLMANKCISFNTDSFYPAICCLVFSGGSTVRLAPVMHLKLLLVPSKCMCFFTGIHCARVNIFFQNLWLRKFLIGQFRSHAYPWTNYLGQGKTIC